MTLLAPEVVGPISEWNTTVRLQGQRTGASIAVYCGGHQVIAAATATTSDEVYTLDPGKHFQANKPVTATQDLGPADGGPSGHSPVPVTVQAAPASLGHVTFVSPLYQCSNLVTLGGAVPGATVHVGVLSGGTFHEHGSDVSADGSAYVFLHPTPAAGEVLVAHQTGGTLKGPNSSSPPAIPHTKAVPAPSVVDANECQRILKLSGVLPGAVVNVKRSSDGSVESGVFDTSWVPFVLAKPLVKDEVLTITQELIAPCNYTSPATVVTVAAVVNFTPILDSPICPHGGVVVTNLQSGNGVRLLANGTVIGEAEAWAATVHLSLPPGVNAGQLITAEQQFCTTWSAPSNAVAAGAPAVSGTITVQPLLVACAGAVHVGHCQPGSTVQIISAMHGEIGQAFPLSDQVHVDVSPQLTAGDTIHAHMSGCGVQADSAPVKVRPGPKELAAPTVHQPLQGTNQVEVTGLEPGAWVDVYVNDVWRAGTFCGLPFALVPIAGGDMREPEYPPLILGDVVKAQQRMCALTSPFSAEVTTKLHPPRAYYVAHPPSGTAPLTVHFENKSTGDNLTKFHWDFAELGTTSDAQTPPDQTFHEGLENSAAGYDVTLTVTNSENESNSYSYEIYANPAPTPSPTVPVIQLQSQLADQTITITGNHFNHGAHIQLAGTATVGGPFAADVTNPVDALGNFTSQPLAWVQPNPQTIITLTVKATQDGGHTWSNSVPYTY